MNDKIKAVLVEAVQNDLKVTVDGKETVRKGERRRYWYHAANYPKDVLDCGDFYEVSPDSALWPTTPDGVEVHCDIGTINDFLDILMRMLEPRELARAHSLPDDFVLTGNKTEQTKQVGNSVPAETAAALCRAMLEMFT